MPVFATSVATAPVPLWARQSGGSASQVTVAPTARVVTPAMLRVQCRLDPGSSGVLGTDDDTLGLFIDAATEYAETRLGTSLMPRTLRAVFNDFSPIDLPRGPIIEILEVAGKDQSPTTDYQIVNYGSTSRIVPTGSIRFPVFVNYRAGHVATDGTTPAVPADIRAAILMHAATLFENRASVSDTSKTPLPHSLEMFYATKSRNVGVG